MTLPTAYIDLTRAELLTVQDIGVLLRVKELALRAIHHDWIAPCARSADGGSASWLFTREAVDSLIARIKVGEVPPALPRNRKETP